MSAWAHIVTGLGVISGATTYWPPLPSCRVGNGLHYILSRIKVGLRWLVNAYSSHSIPGGSSPQSQGGLLLVQRGLVLGCKGISTQAARARFYNRIGQDHGGGHVGL